MRLIIKRAVLGTLMGICAATQVFAANGMTMEQRLQRIERILQNQSLADLVLQVQQLRQEVQQLRGDLEVQKHNMDGMSRRQRDLYLDIDQRLSRFQPDAAQLPATPSVAPAVTSAPPSVPSPQPMPATTQPPPAVGATPQVAVVAPPDPKLESEAYQSAFNMLKQGRYAESITAFSNFLKAYPGGEYEDNAQYWLAEASYVNRDFDIALGEFTKIMEKYPSSPKIPGAMLKIGYIHYEKKNWTDARNILNELITNYPATTESRLAQKRLQRLTKEGH
ncbi:MAG: tol-pal system protein YbgF [Candidatus Thiodiazotropha sp.]